MLPCLRCCTPRTARPAPLKGHSNKRSHARRRRSLVSFYGIKRCIYGSDKVGNKPITCLTPGAIDEGKTHGCGGGGCGSGGKASKGKGKLVREDPAAAMSVPLGGEAQVTAVVSPLSATNDELVLAKAGAPAA